MRATPIPDDEIMEGHERKVIGPPVGTDLDEIRPVEALVGVVGDWPVFRVRILPDDGEVERLAAGEPIWLTFWGGVVPFDVSMMEVE